MSMVVSLPSGVAPRGKVIFASFQLHRLPLTLNAYFTSHPLGKLTAAVYESEHMLYNVLCNAAEH